MSNESPRVFNRRFPAVLFFATLALAIVSVTASATPDDAEGTPDLLPGLFVVPEKSDDSSRITPAAPRPRDPLYPSRFYQAKSVTAEGLRVALEAVSWATPVAGDVSRDKSRMDTLVRDEGSAQVLAAYPNSTAAERASARFVSQVHNLVGVPCPSSTALAAMADFGEVVHWNAGDATDHGKPVRLTAGASPDLLNPGDRLLFVGGEGGARQTEHGIYVGRFRDLSHAVALYRDGRVQIADLQSPGLKDSYRYAVRGALYREKGDLPSGAVESAATSDRGAPAWGLPGTKGKVVAVCVGVGDYSEDTLDRANAAADATSFAAAMGRVYGPGKVSARVLATGADPKSLPTRAGIAQALKTAAAGAGPDDTLVFYFCGSTKDGYLLPTDARLQNGAVVPGSANDLADLLGTTLANSRAGNIWVTLEANVPGSMSASLVSRLTDGGKRAVLFCLAGNTPDARAYEKDYGPQGTHGLFSQALVQGLRGVADADSDGRVTVSELATFVRRRVRADSGGAQTPVIATASAGDGVVAQTRPGVAGR